MHLFHIGDRYEDREFELSVVSENINKSSALDDILRDLGQIHLRAGLCQETQHWKRNGTAEEIGRSLFRAEVDPKATVAVRRECWAVQALKDPYSTSLGGVGDISFVVRVLTQHVEW